MISWLTVADLSPGRTAQSSQDPAWVLRFMTLLVFVDGEGILHVVGGGDEDTGRAAGGGRVLVQPEGVKAPPWCSCALPSTPSALFSVPEGLVADVLERFLPQSSRSWAVLLLKYGHRSFSPSCPLAPHCLTSCIQVRPYTHRVTDASDLPQDMSWLSPASASGDSVPVCSSFLTAWILVSDVYTGMQIHFHLPCLPGYRNLPSLLYPPSPASCLMRLQRAQWPSGAGWSGAFSRRRWRRHGCCHHMGLVAKSLVSAPPAPPRVRTHTHTHTPLSSDTHTPVLLTQPQNKCLSQKSLLQSLASTWEPLTDQLSHLLVTR